MEKFISDGIVIKTSVTGESDRIVFILTSDRGIIRAFAKGARGLKSKLHSSTELFACCSFAFSENKGVYTVSEATVKELFFDLRNDFDSMAVAQYFCEIMLKTVPDEHSDRDYLRLILNSLWLISSKKKSVQLVKAVFELRSACISGYMPALIACDMCGEFETENMFFDCLSGLLFCDKCGKDSNLPCVPLSVVKAMRHIMFSDFDKIFSFELSDDNLFILNRITQIYIQNVYQQKFKTLEYINF